MQKRSIAVMLSSLAAVIMLAAAPTVAVYAEGSTGSGSGSSQTEDPSDDSATGDSTTPDVSNTNHTTLTNKGNIHREDNAQTTGERSGDGVTIHRFDAKKLRACDNRKGKITSIIDRVVERGQNQINLFDKITARTEAFYTSKGKTLENYDQLVAAVESAKTQAETDLAAVKANSTFKCDADNPQADIDAFKAAVKQEIQDLKTYRTAVKNLIVGVKSVQGDA